MFVICLVITVLSVNCQEFQRTSRRRSSSVIDKYMQESVNLHITQMKTSCSEPRLQVFYPESYGPHQMLTPRGTYLNRCNAQTGCCPNILHSCQPIETKPIVLVFYVQTMKIERNSKIRHFNQVKNITLVDHIKFRCLPNHIFGENN